MQKRGQDAWLLRGKRVLSPFFGSTGKDDSLVIAHLRANLLLAVLTLAVCCGVYPLILWAAGQAVLSSQADGSLVTGQDGKVIGSQLIAQPFGGDEYFQPRPSAVGYNAAASGASNWGASNYLLRNRAARILGPIVKYKNSQLRDKTVQQDLAEWFKSQPNAVAEWATAHPGVAQAWVNADDKHKAAVNAWAATNPEAVDAWKQANPGAAGPQPADLAEQFFVSNARAFTTPGPNLSTTPPGRSKRSFLTPGCSSTRTPTWKLYRPTWSWRRARGWIPTSR